MNILLFAALGVGIGGVYSLLGMAIVVVNLGSGILNFSTGAVGMFAAFLFYRDLSGGGMPLAVAVCAAVAAAAVIGVITNVLFTRWLASASPTSQVVATLAVMTIILQAVNMTWAQGGTVFSVNSPLPTGPVTIGSGIAVTQDRFIIPAMAVALCLILLAVQRWTRVGLAVRAVAENRIVAASTGWSPGRLGALAWGAGSALAALAAILAAPLAGLDSTTLTFLVVPGLAAALVGSFRSLTGALLGGLLLGILESEVVGYVSASGWSTAAPSIAVVILLAVRGRTLPSRSDGAERRPAVGRGILRPGVILGCAAVAAAVLLTAPSTWLDPVITTITFALLLLSVIVVTGYAGQLSLAQMGLAGLGAYFTAVFAVSAGLSPVLALFLSTLTCLPIGLLVAIPALRTRSWNLAVATLSLAVAIDSLIISNPAATSRFSFTNLHDVRIFGFDLSAAVYPRRYGIATLLVFTVVAVCIAGLRRSWSGQRLLAVRSNERAAASLGISVVRAKLYAFALATLIAAAAGSLIELHLGVVDLSSFTLVGNIEVILVAVVAGVGWVAGSVLGALGVPGAVTASIVSAFTADGGDWLLLASGVLGLLVVLQSPDGIAPLARLQVLAIWRFASSVARRFHVARPPGTAGRGVAPSETSGSRAATGVQHGPAPAASTAAERSGRAREREFPAPRLLEATGLTVRFGGQLALEGVSIRLERGNAVGLIGPNGAGKSTLIDSLTGFQRYRGHVLLDGAVIDKLGPNVRAQAGVRRSFQTLELFEDMTVRENVQVASERGAWHRYYTDLVPRRSAKLKPHAETALRELGLWPYLDHLPHELDYARRRLVALARGLSARPAFLLLDEPAAGLDRSERGRLAELLARVPQEWGIGLLIVDHDVEVVFRTCDRIVVLDRGQVIAAGGPGEVREDSAVIAAYLGSGVRSGEAAERGEYAR